MVMVCIVSNMIKFFKQLFCKHDYNLVSETVKEMKGKPSPTKTYWCSKWYIDSYVCTKCKKPRIDITPYT